jgi:hypothetical protein
MINESVPGRVSFLLFFILWFFILVFGLIDSITRNVPDYPDARRPVVFIGQIELYVLIPLCFVLINVLFLFYRKLPKIIVTTIILIQFILFLIFIAFSAGGI